ncbi:MAG: S9 family peptidase [Candidatus Eiseniibacteriota bacterium]
MPPVRHRLVRAAAGVVVACAVALSGSTPVVAQSMKARATQVKLPKTPVPQSASASSERFDVERYLNIREARSPDLSPSGASVAFLTNITGTNQVWRIAATGGWPEQVTFGSEPVDNVMWSPVSEDRLIFSRDVGGNERRQFLLADLATGSERRLTTRDDVIHNWGGWSRDGKRIAYTSNERNQAYFDLYVMDVETATPKLVWQRDGSLFGGGFSPDGRRYLVLEFSTPSNQNVYLADLEAGGEPVLLTPHEGNARYTQLRWAADGRGFWLVSDEGREFLNPAYYDLSTRKMSFRDTIEWDVERLTLSDDGRYLAWVVNEDGYGRLHLKDLRLRSATQAIPVPELPDGVIFEPVFARDGSKLAFRLSGPTSPSNVWIYDLKLKKARQLTQSSTAGIPAGTFVRSTLLRYPTSDGKQISGFFYRPLDAGNRPVSVVITVHGGPESQSEATFSGLTQYYVNRGFGVFYPNVRGSTGYGKAFTHLDDVEKRLDSVRDLAEGAKWLVEQGYALPGRVAVTGGSYGGYMTLAALAFHPDLWACGVDVVGISNLRTFIANTGSWRQSLRAAEYGDPEKDGAAMDAASPIHRVQDIRAPLLVIQGANDPRVPKSEADQMVEAIKKRGGVVEYLLFPDEGHGLAKLPNRIKGYTRAADFLEQYLLPGAPSAAGTPAP